MISEKDNQRKIYVKKFFTLTIITILLEDDGWMMTMMDDTFLFFLFFWNINTYQLKVHERLYIYHTQHRWLRNHVVHFETGCWLGRSGACPIDLTTCRRSIETIELSNNYYIFNYIFSKIKKKRKKKKKKELSVKIKKIKKNEWS